MIKPTEIRYIKKTNTLSLTFEDGLNVNLTSEYLRCFSPSAEVKGHAPGQEAGASNQVSLSKLIMTADHVLFKAFKYSPACGGTGTSI